MSKYYLKDHVTDEMLEAVGFEPYFDEDFQCITSYSRLLSYNTDLPLLVGWQEQMVMISWDNNCAYSKYQIGYAYSTSETPNGNVDIDYIQDLLELGYVEVRE